MQLNINTPGCYLSVKDQLFTIRSPADEKGENYRFKHIPPQKISSIIFNARGSLSTAAITLALEHHIDILFMEEGQKSLGRVWHGRPGSTTKIRKAQLLASMDARGLDWVQGWIAQKLSNQAAHLRALAVTQPEQAPALQEAAEKIIALGAAISTQEGESTGALADQIRGREGSAGRQYFAALSQALPEAWQFQGRSSRPAADGFNALLNYGYALLYSRVEKALMVAGLDPFTGFLHRDDYNQLSMVYDFIEPYRVWVEEVVMQQFLGRKAPFGESMLNPSGKGIWLNEEGKKLIQSAFRKYMEDQPIAWKDSRRSRARIIQLDAHHFANRLLDSMQD